MGSNRYKITYECDCGIDWGSCGRKNYWLLSYHRGSDTATLYHKHHATKPNPNHPADGVLETVQSFDDNKLKALREILDMDATEPWSDEDLKEAPL